MGEVINIGKYRNGPGVDADQIGPQVAVDPIGIDSVKHGPLAIANYAIPRLIDSVTEFSDLEGLHAGLSGYLFGGEASEEDYFAGMAPAEAKTELARVTAELEAARARRSCLFELTYNQIDQAAADGNDPVGYLAAALNVQYPGYGLGNDVSSGLGYLLRAGQRDEIPVAVIGSDLYGFTVGNYAGIPIVRRPGAREYRFDNSSRLALYLQLANVSGFANTVESNSPYRPWNYEGNGIQEVESRQLMRRLIVTDRPSEILEAALYGGGEEEGTRIDEIDSNLKRHLRLQTGMPGQAIVYGHSAVKGILAFLHGKAVPKTDLEHLANPSKDEILAAGLSIGISPSELSTGIIGFRRRLAAHFIGTLTHSVVSQLRNENFRLGGVKVNSTLNWSILASPQVYRYLGMGDHDLAMAAVNGLAIFERLSARKEFSRSHGLGNERLSHAAAAQTAAKLIAARYAVELDPTGFSAELSKLPVVDESLSGTIGDPVIYIADVTKRKERRQ